MATGGDRAAIRSYKGIQRNSKSIKHMELKKRKMVEFGKYYTNE